MESYEIPAATGKVAKISVRETCPDCGVTYGRVKDRCRCGWGSDCPHAGCCHCGCQRQRCVNCGAASLPEERGRAGKYWCQRCWPNERRVA